jgi:hypothetical protein
VDGAGLLLESALLRRGAPVRFPEEHSIINTPLCTSVLSVVNFLMKISPQRAERYTEVSFSGAP